MGESVDWKNVVVCVRAVVYNNLRFEDVDPRPTTVPPSHLTHCRSFLPFLPSFRRSMKIKHAVGEGGKEAVHVGAVKKGGDFLKKHRKEKLLLEK